MKVIPIEGATLTVPELIEMARDGAVILTRDGLPVVEIRDVSGSDPESASLASNPKFAGLIDRSRRSHRVSGGIRLDFLREELGLDANPSDR